MQKKATNRLNKKCADKEHLEVDSMSKEEMFILASTFMNNRKPKMGQCQNLPSAGDVHFCILYLFCTLPFPAEKATR